MPTQPRQLHDAPELCNAGQPAPARADERLALTLEKSALVVALVIVIILPLGYFALAFEITHSLRGVLSGTALMALLGLLLGGTAYTTLRILPLRALRRATAALHQEQDYWKFALEGGGDGVWDRNVQTGEILHSKRYLEMFGYTGDEPASLLQDWESRIHPDDLPRVKTSQQAYFDGTTTLYTNEHRMRCKDGGWKWVLTRGMLVSRDAAGKPLRIIGAHTDITERKQAEEAHAKLAAIVDSSNDAIVSLSLDRKILSWNAAAERLFGYAAAEIIGQDIALFIPLDRTEETAHNHALLAQGHTVIDRESVRLAKGGRRIQVSLSQSPIMDERGAIVGVSLIYRDISERKQAKQARANLAAIVENSNDAIISHSFSGIILSCNAAAERMLGYSAGEMIGRPNASIHPPGWTSRIARNTERVRHGEVVAPHESHRLTKDGRVIDVLTSHSPVRDHDGKIVGASVILHDISALKQAAAAVQESEERFRAIASNLPGVVYQFLRQADGTPLFTYVSDGSLELFDLNPGAIQDNAGLFLDLILPGDKASYYQSMAASSSNLTTWNWEGRIRNGSGNEIKWISLRASPRKTSQEAVLWDGIMADITQNKLAEIEVKHSHEQLAELSSYLQNVKEQERARIAREIHDDLGGTLTAIKIDLLWLHNRLHEERRDLQEKVDSMDLLADRAIEATARIASDLRPGILDFGIVAAIEWQAREFQSRTGIRCETASAREEISLDPDLSVNLFRIFQETLTNVMKHANASMVRVTIGESDGWLDLEVHDNGRGITRDDRSKPKSFGIRGMLERARILGGKIEISGAPRQGTTLSVRLPSTEASEPAAEQQYPLF